MVIPLGSYRGTVAEQNLNPGPQDVLLILGLYSHPWFFPCSHLECSPCRSTLIEIRAMIYLMCHSTCFSRWKQKCPTSFILIFPAVVPKSTPAPVLTEEMHREGDLSLLKLMHRDGFSQRKQVEVCSGDTAGTWWAKTPWVDGPAPAPLCWAVLCLALLFWRQMVLQLVASCSWALPAWADGSEGPQREQESAFAEA